MSKSMSALALAAVSIASPGWAGTIEGADVQRAGPDKLTIVWHDSDPVDLFVTADPASGVIGAKLLSDDDDDGRYVLDRAGTERRFFLLRDEKTEQIVTVAERLLPLQQGSNFRDIGGYPAAGGKHVRWGLIYRSGASPMLTDADVQQVHSLGLTKLVDLRSSEERALAPTRIDGVPYAAFGYSMASLNSAPGKPMTFKNGGAIYRNFPTLLAPQLRILFADLLKNAGPVAYNCSAGQDRTGFVTAMVLSALGTPREVIYQDYHLSTRYRQPANEMPWINLAAHPNNAAAEMFARSQNDPRGRVLQPLKEADGTPFLAAAFDEIEKRWGSVDAYLDQEIGVDSGEIEQLRAIYLQ
jgi:protein-tyrosine phosphatase